MSVPRVRRLAVCLVLGACGGDGATANGTPRLAAVVSSAADEPKVAADLRAALAAHDVGVVVALDASGLRAARTVLSGSARPAAHLVAIADPSLVDAKSSAETLVADVTGAEVAVDLALLAASGVAVPPHVGVGTRTIAMANVAAGGAPRVAAGDFAVEMLRRQHADKLAAKPANDVVVPVALVQMRADGGRQDRVRAETEAAARRYPQLGLRSQVGDGSAARFALLVGAALRENARVVMLVASDWSAMADVAAVPRDGTVALIAVDAWGDVPGATTVVGADQQILGRAAGEAARPLLGAQGACILLHGDVANEAVRLRREGFTEALGPRQR